MDHEIKAGDLRVWWITQMPGKPFLWSVTSVEDGRRLIACLAAYDEFQIAEIIKPDCSNVGGIERYEDGEWCELAEDAD